MTAAVVALASGYECSCPLPWFNDPLYTTVPAVNDRPGEQLLTRGNFS